VVRALDLRLEVAGSIPAVALSSATLDKLFTLENCTGTESGVNPIPARTRHFKTVPAPHP